MKRVTIKDVAAHAGVSFATVSRVLDDRPEISPATKERVRAACQTLGYVPNIAARGLVKRRARTIGLVVPDVTNPYFSAIALTAETYAREHGYRILFCNSLRDPAGETEVVESLMQQQVDGLIAAPISPASQARIQAVIGPLPCIYLGNNHDTPCSYIVVDNAGGAYEGTRYLISLGHRHIVFLGGRATSRTRAYRLKGFHQAAREAGIRYEDMYVEPGVEFFRANYELAYELLGRADRPTAIFAFSDRTALGVLQAAEERGVRIPEDLSLLGFDNITFSSLPRIDLTTVSQHKHQIGELAVKRLLQKIEGEPAHFHDVLSGELIVRSSCRPPA